MPSIMIIGQEIQKLAVVQFYKVCLSFKADRAQHAVIFEEKSVLLKFLFVFSK